MASTSNQIFVALFVCSAVASFVACSEPNHAELFPAAPHDAGGGGQGGAGGQDAGPSGCDGCGGATPICVDDDHCAAACPDGRAACDPAGDAGPTACCAQGDQCCEASAHGYAGGDLCRPAREPCPEACPGGTTVCPLGESCLLDPDTSTYSCVADCAPTQICDANLCCPLGSTCAEGGCPLPDLSIDQGVIEDSVRIEDQSFAADSCEVVEGCIGAPGARRLLRFSVETPNLGQGNLFLGDPANNPLFVYSPCHGHYHFNGYANYRLLDASGQEVGSGHKQAFCLLDFEPYAPNAPPDAIYTCSNQGIQAGWADVYTWSLPCQWVDITGVPPGDYTLEVQVNEAHAIAESDYTNNTVTTPITIPADSCPNGCREPSEACCQPGDPCGWAADGSCDCAAYFAWDDADCAACSSADPACDFTNTCPGGCTPNVGMCCDPADPCGLAGNGACDCGGAFDWDLPECVGCTTQDPDCPVNSCPNGCTAYDPTNPCCGPTDTCGWTGDGWCDCGGAAWDAVDCASCLSPDPDCP